VAPALAIGVIAIGVRLAFGPQVDGLDDAGYLDAARRVSEGGSLDHLFALFRTRVGMAYPLGWLVQAGWLDTSQFWVLTLVAECVTMVSLVAAGWLLTGAARAGLAAAALYAVYPLAVQQAAMYCPTPFQVASIAAAVALIAAAERGDGLRRVTIAFAAGVTLGIGYLFKEDVALLVPAMVLATLIARFPRVGTAMSVCAGAALVFGVESLAYWGQTGEPLYRLAATSGLGAQISDSLQIAAIWRWDAFVRSLWLMPVQVGLLWWLAIPALWMAWRCRRVPGLAFITVLFLIVMAYLQFGSGSLSTYSPLPKTPRYTALATPLLMLVTGAWLAALWATRRRAAIVAAAAIVIAAVPCLFYLNVSASERTRNTIAALPVVKDLPAASLYTDYYTARVLRALNPDRDIRVWYHANFKTNEMLVQSSPEPGAGSYVLLDRQAAKVYTSSYEMVLPPQVSSPPASWQTVWTHRAYPEHSMSRSALEGLRAAASWLPGGNPLSSRVNRSIADIIDGDQAALYRVP
jgi:hypothetical protein